MKAENLNIGALYQDTEGLYIYKGKRNQYLYEFDEVTLDKNDDIIVIDDNICKTKNEVEKLF